MGNKPRILIVDDDSTSVKILQRNLAPEGYDIAVTSSGEEALDLITNNNIDLILLDIVLPKMDGFELTRRLKANEKTKFIPVVLLTSLNKVQDRAKGLQIGCNDFLSRPVEKSELLARVRSLLSVKTYHDLMMHSYSHKLEIEVKKKTEQLHSAYKKLEIASLDTIYRLATAAEYKDEDTGVHTKRMGYYAVALALQMGFSQKEINEILYAAPMHDVGKIGIPDNILLKPGKLVKEEWEIMKQHTEIGAKILEGSDTEFIKSAEIIALTHHEKWDGSGYPHALKGSNIPIIGRITSISDVFDALVSKRPYKEPFSVEKSFEIIEQERGKYFDPKVVDAFFAAKKKILEIRDKYNDSEQSKLFQLHWKIFKNNNKF
ncbi:MAG: two-component system response regulator [Candidatus Omnitrophota bacterium]